MEVDEKRQRSLSRKALQNEIENKRKELGSDANVLQNAFDNALGKEEHDDLRLLQDATEKYKETLLQLTELYQHDKWGDYEEEAKLTMEYSRLERAHGVITQARDSQDHDRRSHTSRQSRHSSISHSSCRSSASSARRRALTEASAAKKQAEFDKLIAEKERTRRLREAEEYRKKEERQAQHDLDMALLTADRAKAIADARVEAIERCINEELDIENEQDLGTTNNQRLELSDEQVKRNAEERVRSWVDTHPNTLPTPNPTHHLPSLPVAASTPKQDHTIGLLESFTATNQRLVSGLSKQSLPKCHPDIFDGEVTLFHPWKRSFKAMIEDADVTPAQEMNYLRNFTNGEVQNVVDNFRRRHHSDLSVVLQQL
ncbi:hypothetical protein QZH41_006443 [Actinostola sp. cb2023]|nr:hypothetical protein QZH41_006443 [Actinostola sp. cb2023]